MNRSIYNQKAQYVNEVLRCAMLPMDDFGSIEYARCSITEEEYIRVSDKIGGVAYLDVTAESMEDILKNVVKLILGAEMDLIPKGLITDKPKLKEVSALFRRKI